MAFATFAGGCFWCTETLFARLYGVDEVIPGYTGGNIKNPAYKEVCTGRTGHAECVQITFNETSIAYKTLLEVFLIRTTQRHSTAKETIWVLNIVQGYFIIPMNKKKLQKRLLKIWNNSKGFLVQL